MQPPVQVIPPTYSVLSVDEAKQQCRIDVEMTDDDALVESLVNGATRHLEMLLGLAFVVANWRQDFSEFDDCLRLPLRPVAPSSVVIKYRDEDDVEQTLSADTYSVIGDNSGHYIELKSGESWPSTFDRFDAVSVYFDAGNEVADVPEDLKLAVRLLVGAWYENREQTVIGVSVSELPRSVAVESLISPYRQMYV